MGYMLPHRTSQADQARALITRKENIEAEIETQHEILRANFSTLSTPLVDSEGFPRADIDVWAVRHARVRIIELRNDYTAIMDEIGTALQGVYGPSASTSAVEADSLFQAPPPSTPEEIQAVDPQQPFARVDGVLPRSPADEAVCRLFVFHHS